MKNTNKVFLHLHGVSIRCFLSLKMFSLNKDRELVINIHVAYHIKFPDKVYNFALNEADFKSGVGMLHLFLRFCN